MFTEKMLAQARPLDTNAVSIYTPSGNARGISKNFLACNTTETEETFRMFISQGTNYDETTAIFYDVVVAPKGTVALSNMVIIDNGANMAVSVSSGDSITFTVFGAEFE